MTTEQTATPDPRLCDAAGRPLPFERMTPKQRRLAQRLHAEQMRAAGLRLPRSGDVR